VDGVPKRSPGSASKKGKKRKTQMTEWLHSFGKYVDYAVLGTEPPKLMKIIEKWGAAFDEEYWYWIGGRTVRYLKRAPVWMYGQKGLGGRFTEKRKPYVSGKQSKLSE
jgi:hypothetical protein